MSLVLLLCGSRALKVGPRTEHDCSSGSLVLSHSCEVIWKFINNKEVPSLNATNNNLII